MNVIWTHREEHGLLELKNVLPVMLNRYPTTQQYNDVVNALLQAHPFLDEDGCGFAELLYYNKAIWLTSISRLRKGFPDSSGKNLPTIQETPVLFLGQEDLLEKGKATYSNILAWRIPWTLQSMGSQRVAHN